MKRKIPKLTMPHKNIWYTPQDFKGAEERELRKEYSRLRSIARKRLERIAPTEFAQSATYRYNMDKYKRVADINSVSELKHLLADVSRYIAHPKSGTLSGLKEIREEKLERWKEAGYTFVNKENYFQILNFLDAVRSRNMGKLPASDILMEFLDEQEESLKMPSALLAEKFESWYETKQKSEYYKTQNKQRQNSMKFKKTFTRGED